MAQTSSNNGGTDQVLVEERGSVRTFILNRPKQLNALSFQMISRLTELFYASEEDSNVKMIILKGQGRAFCAVVIFQLFFIMLTRVSILNGIVMGSGAGASIHGRFRVATEKSVFAMPETALGLFPDVGASYFLSRLPGFFGEYAGLTGSRLDGAEMLACGLATHFISSDKLPLLEQALVKVNTSDPDAISAIICRFSHIPKLKEESPYYKYVPDPPKVVHCRIRHWCSSIFEESEQHRLMKIINRCFSQRTIEEIISTLESEALDKKDGWISSTIQSLKKASPTSLKISLKSIREGRLQGVGSCLVREYKMVCHVLRRDFSKDFFEGCRTILIDKDRNPKWEPTRLELIRDDDVDRYFSKIDDEDWQDLKLPPKSNLPPYATAKL